MKEVAAKAGIKPQDAAVVVDTLFDLLKEKMTTGEKVIVKGFGTFERREVQARMMKNPATGADLAVPAKFKPAFKAADAFRTELSDKAGPPGAQAAAAPAAKAPAKAAAGKASPVKPAAAPAKPAPAQGKAAPVPAKAAPTPAKAAVPAAAAKKAAPKK